MKYRLINEHRHVFGVKTMCRVLRVALSGFYQWLHKPLLDRAIEDRRLLQLIHASYAASGWVTDITYIRTWQGWLYLAVVVDLYSRMEVGWSMKPTLAKEIVLNALLIAVWRRKPKQSVIIHSDQGSQYGSDDWLRLCKAYQLEPSMSRRGNCWDNAVAESFFSNLKKERVKKRIYKTRDLARADVFDYIEMFYNRTDGTAISAASVTRPLSRPHNEAGACLLYQGKSNKDLAVSISKSSAY